MDTMIGQEPLVTIKSKEEQRTGKDLILATKPYAQEVRGKSWLYMLSTLLLLVGSLIGTLFMPFHESHPVVYYILRISCSILAGIFTIRMFVIYHDFLHHAILHKSFLATVLMTIFGIYMMAPTSIWKRSHDYHHKHNSKLYSASIGSYPIATKGKFLQMTPRQQRAYLATRHPLTILMGYFSMFMIGMSWKSFKSAPRKHPDSLIALVIHVVASVLVFYFCGWQGWLLSIIIPYLIPCTLGAYLFYAQHNFPTVTFSDNKEWKYEKAALESSSYMKMSKLGEWITANIGYHHIHHLNSRIPFYRLPEVMKAFPELQKAKVTTLRFSDIRKCLSLKLWDPERGQMIPLRMLRG
jgi:omega-6 fatty acid desaturase (delta-12 desaturase)